MAAYTKTGLTFYSIDTDRYQDRKIKRLKKDFGCNGVAVYDYILCEIYRVKGSYLEWDVNTAFDVAEYFGLEEGVVADIVQFCASIGLFDDKILSKGVITSESIQRRYIDMCTKARRKIIAIPSEYRLLIKKEATEFVDNNDAGKPDSNAMQIIPVGDNPILSVQPVTLDDEISQLMSEDYWFEQLQLIHNIGKEKLKSLLFNEFKAQCVADGKEFGHANMKDVKSHFNSWLRKHNERRNTNDRQQGNNDRRRGSEVTASSSQAYEGGF